MFRNSNGQFKVTPPATIVFDGFVRKFADLTREEWDELGYNEAQPVRRAPYTTYETAWVKGDDLIYREEILSTIMDEATQFEVLKTAKLDEIRDKAQAFLDDVAQREYPQWEIETWKDQETEAVAFMADNTVDTPVMEGICAARSMDKVILAKNILENAAAWRPVAAYIVGQRLKFHDALKMATLPEHIEAIEVAYALPEA